MSSKQYTAKNTNWIAFIDYLQEKNMRLDFSIVKLTKIDWLIPLRNWLNNIEISDRALAHRLCKIIPTQCPFERKIKLFGRTILNIPPLCKLNPLYDEVISLRFRALCYLADGCGEDISAYC